MSGQTAVCPDDWYFINFNPLSTLEIKFLAVCEQFSIGFTQGPILEESNAQSSC